MRDVTVTFLGVGDRESIIEMFPFAEQADDDVGSTVTQHLSCLQLVEGADLETDQCFSSFMDAVVLQFSREVPSDVDLDVLIRSIQHEVTLIRTLWPMLNERRKSIQDDRDKFWFMLSWSTSDEEECDAIH